MPVIAGAAVVVGLFWLGSRAVENIGDGLDDAGNGALKLTVAAGVAVAGYAVLRKAKVL